MKWLCAVGITPLIALCEPSLAQSSGAQSSGAWSERVQVVYDSRSHAVSRLKLKAWDAAPALNLEFTWEPDPGETFAPLADGTIEGRGKLVWRVRGSAAHDRRSIHSTYVGDIRLGRPHGGGRLETREGEVFEGAWVAGVLDGEGMWLDASGNRYTGTFRSGLPDGSGRQAMADGSIYEGGFRGGRRHGEGTVRLAGGAVYGSTWQDGVEVASKRPDAVPDATLGGLLRAQSGGGDAGKVAISVTVDPRMTQQADLQYTHVVLDDRIEIYPQNAGMVEAWIGEAPIIDFGYEGTFDYIDWSDAASFWQVEFATDDGSRVKLDTFELQVEDSQVYRKPFLSVVAHRGCVGYRPGFSLQNNGWGAVSDASLSFQFYNIENPEAVSRSFSADVGDFDEATDIPLAGVFEEAGVDTNALAAARFSCPSIDQLPQCRADAIDSLDMGDLSGLLDKDASSGSMYTLELGVRGKLSYRWDDDRGNSYEAEEQLEAPVQLAIIEADTMVAEGGDGWGGSPEALRYQKVELPADRQDYVIDMPVRGNKNLAAYVARLKVYAEHNSIHNFRATVRLADGSIRQSKPVAYFHIRPRETYYEPPEPAGCYLDPMYGGVRKSG